MYAIRSYYALRPAIVWVESGTPRLIRRRETLADLVSRDLRLDGSRLGAVDGWFGQD